MVKFTAFSKKQLFILSWWNKNSKYKDYQGIIADGSIRSGKTLSMVLSFIFWAMQSYSGQQFGMSGKSVGSFNRNITFWLVGTLKQRGYKVRHNIADHILEISIKNKETGKIHTNYFYIFGGTDERSYQFIQGFTAAGWFFDEVALQPESFVNQATGRCSVDGAKIWFNCNPDKPLHWFKKEYIDKCEEKHLVHLHFIMEDNPSLSKQVIDRYKSMYSGVFYLRYILGQWALAEGIIYDMITDANYYTDEIGKKKWEGVRYISIDYGTINPTCVLNHYDCWDVSYLDDEYYYDSKERGKQKTDEEIADDIEAFIAREPQPVERIIIDPSAASLKAVLRNRGWLVKDADNEVLAGIRITASAFQQKKLLINKNKCLKTIDELGSYIWDEKSKDRGVEKPVKENDHACILGDTLIETKEGKKKIKDLVGTSGKCYCINTKTKRKAIGNYSNVMCTGKNKKCYKVKLSNGKVIEATEDHYVLTKKGWKQIKDLNIKEDKVVKINNYDLGYSLLDIDSIEYIGEHDVYNMEVDKYHNYAIDGGIILHNCDSLRYYVKTIMGRRIEGRE